MSLIHLKNIGNTSALWLKTVGIESIDDLKTIGACEAYIRVGEYGIKTSKVFLYALQGALLNIHWNKLEPDLKKQLCAEVDTLLKNRNEPTRTV